MINLHITLLLYVMPSTRPRLGHALGAYLKLLRAEIARFTRT